MLVLILHSKVFFGQTSSNWLKFGTGVDCYMLISILMFIFSKFLSFIFFWKNCDLKIWSSPNQLKFGAGVHCYMLIASFIFIFSKFLSVIFFLGKFGPIIWSSTKWLKLCTLLYAYYDFNDYFFKILSFIQFWVNLVQKSNILQIYWNLIQGYIVICWLRFSCVVFQSVSRSEIFGANFIPKSFVLYI